MPFISQPDQAAAASAIGDRDYLDHARRWLGHVDAAAGERAGAGGGLAEEDLATFRRMEELVLGRTPSCPPPGLVR